MKSDRDKQAEYDVVIIGMGPVGLAAAYELAKNGNKILLIEKRPEEEGALRPQVIVLTPERKLQLLRMISSQDVLDDTDIKFLNTIIHSSTIKISAIQRFILNRINNLNAQIHPSSAIDLLYQTNLVSADMNKGQVELKTGNEASLKQVSFKHLIGADGAKSETLALVNATLDKTHQIHKSTPEKMQHIKNTYHLAAYVKLTRTDGQALVLPDKALLTGFIQTMNTDNKSKSHQLYFLRFEKKHIDKDNSESSKLNFIGEIPRDIYDKYQSFNQKIKNYRQTLDLIRNEKQEVNGMADEEIQAISNIEKLTMEYMQSMIKERNAFVLPYVKHAVAAYLHIDENSLNISVKNSKKTPAKDKLKLLTFKGSSKKANKAAIQINDRGFYLIGDAYFTPHYAIGHGLNDGLEAAAKLGHLPSNTGSLSKHIVEYNNLAAHNAQRALFQMGMIYWIRKLGGTQAKLAHRLEAEVENRENEHKIDLKQGLLHTNSTNIDTVTRHLLDKFDARKFYQYDEHHWNYGHLIQEWDQFIMDNPAIVKQYRVDIWHQLTEINRCILAHGSALIKNHFNTVYEKYANKITEYNNQLIDMARHAPNKMDHSGHTPHYHAVQFGDIETIEKTLLLGSDPNKATKYSTIFTKRARHDPAITQLLLKYGADPFKSTHSLTIDGKKINFSAFSSSLLESGNQFNPHFGIACLIAYKNSQSGLHRGSIANVSKDTINIIIQEISACSDLKWKSGFNEIKDNKEIIALLKKLMDDKLLSKVGKITEMDALDRHTALITLKKFTLAYLDMLKEEKFFKLSASSLFRRQNKANQHSNSSSKPSTHNKSKNKLS